MPDHLHLLITPQAITLERAIGLIKGGFSYRLASSFRFGSAASPTTASKTQTT